MSHRIATLATVPDREHLLDQVIESLIPQVDRVYVYLNGHDELPASLRRETVHVAWSKDHGDLGDAGKFFWAGRLPDNCYHFTCDDDLIYPDDYASTLADAIDYYGRQALISVHGAILREPITSYYKCRKVYPCLESLDADHQADVLGTGVLAYHTDTIDLSIHDFPIADMTDIWLAVAAKHQHVPRIVIAHERGWLRYLPPPKGTTIYERYGATGDDSQQTRVLVAESPWTLDTDLDVAREK
ncbi:MAG: hypothetical protein GTO41_02335 [Burkholderiales bacterium]|nr:hypothetical protein [Burkholderiales bacterium]